MLIRSAAETLPERADTPETWPTTVFAADSRHFEVLTTEGKTSDVARAGGIGVVQRWMPAKYHEPPPDDHEKVTVAGHDAWIQRLGTGERALRSVYWWVRADADSEMHVVVTDSPRSRSDADILRIAGDLDRCS